MPKIPVLRPAAVFFLIIFFLGVTSPISAQNTPKAANEAYFEGLRRYQDGQPELAIEHFENFLKEHPDDPLAASAAFHVTKAKAMIDPDNMDGYYEQYIAAWPVHPHALDLILDMAHARNSEGRYDEAIALYKRASERTQQDRRGPQIWYWMAEAAIAKENHNEARRYFQVVVDSYPSSDWAPKALFAQGSLYLRDENFPMASSSFERLKEKYPRSQAARNIGTALGESYYMQGRYDEAINHLKSVQSTLSGEARARAVFLIAESYNAIDEYEEASNYYLQYINLTEGQAEQRRAHYGLGWLYYKQEIYHWAAESFAKAAVGDDELARKALYYKAVNEKVGGRYREALETFEEFGNRFKNGLWIEEAYYEWALTAFEVGNYPQAIEVCLDLIRRDMAKKQPGLVFILLGEAYYANNEFTRAIQAFDAAAQSTNLDPDVIRQARFQKGWALFREMAYDAAQPIFEALVREHPNGSFSAEALFWNADSYFNMGNYQQAALLFQRFIDQHPRHELIGAARYSLGWSQFKLGEYEKAIPPLQAFLRDYKPPPIALYPYDVDTNLRIGDAYFALREYGPAIDAYRKVTGARQGGDYALYQIAISYNRAQQTYEAINTFRQLVDNYIDSNFRAQAQYNIGYIYLQENNPDQAVAEFQTLIRLAPGTEFAAQAQYNIGDAWYNAGEYEKAIEAYKLVIERYPRSKYVVEAINSLGDARLAIGQDDNSTELMEQFLASNPNASDADRVRLERARSFLDAGDFDRAIDEYRSADRLASNDATRAEAQFNLAYAYEKKGDQAAAARAYTTIVEQYGNTTRAGNALANLGRMAYERGDYNASLTYYQRLANDHPRMKTEAQVGMGNAYLALGNAAKAKEAFGGSGTGNSDAVRLGLAKADIADGNFAEAEKVLKEIASSNSSVIGAEAQYNLGRAQQLSGRCEEALTSFAAVKMLFGIYEHFVAIALLEQSRCTERLGDAVNARRLLQQVANDYPNTSAGREAARLLRNR